MQQQQPPKNVEAHQIWVHSTMESANYGLIIMNYVNKLDWLHSRIIIIFETCFLNLGPWPNRRKFANQRWLAGCCLLLKMPHRMTFKYYLSEFFQDSK